MITHEGVATAEPASPPEPVDFRPSLAQLLVTALPLIAFVASVSVVSLLGPRHSWRFAAMLVAWAAFIALEIGAVQFSQRTRLTAAGLRTVGRRRRRIAWSRIAAIRVEPVSLRKTVVVYEFDGRRTRLRFPTAGALYRDKNFDAKVRTLEQWWLVQRAAVPSVRAANGVRVRKDGSVRIGGVVAQSGTAALLLGALAATNGAYALAGLAWGHPRTAGDVAGIVLLGMLVLLCATVALRACLHASVVLDGEVMRVRRAFAGRRDIPARDIRALTTVRRRGGVRFAVELEGGGGRLVLPKPRVGVLLWDEDFGLRTALIRDWWLEQRGKAMAGRQAAAGAAATGPEATSALGAQEAAPDGPWDPRISWLPPVWRRLPVYVVSALAVAGAGVVLLIGLILVTVAASSR